LRIESKFCKEVSFEMNINWLVAYRNNWFFQDLARDLG